MMLTGIFFPLPGVHTGNETVHYLSVNAPIILYISGSLDYKTITWVNWGH